MKKILKLQHLTLTVLLIIITVVDYLFLESLGSFTILGLTVGQYAFICFCISMYILFAGKKILFLILCFNLFFGLAQSINSELIEKYPLLTFVDSVFVNLTVFFRLIALILGGVVI